MTIPIPRKVLSTAAVIVLCSGLARVERAQEPAATPGGAQEHNNVRPAIRWKQFRYTCENGVKVIVYLHDTTAKVRFQDKEYLMKQTVSADGNRYSDGKMVWWGRGDDGFLQEDAPDGDGKMLVKDCVQDKAASASEVSGTVTYLVRMALPPQAVVEVQLQDVSLADAAAKVIAEQKFTLGNRQVPLPFTLKYDPGKIDLKHSYAVRAQISTAGELKFATDQVYKVITQGNPSKVDLILKPAKP
jgi:putative lipoprotein